MLCVATFISTIIFELQSGHFRRKWARKLLKKFIYLIAAKKKNYIPYARLVACDIIIWC